jgi:hypothetical protein
MLPELSKLINVISFVFTCMIIILVILIIYTWYNHNDWIAVIKRGTAGAD